MVFCVFAPFLFSLRKRWVVTLVVGRVSVARGKGRDEELTRIADIIALLIVGVFLVGVFLCWQW